MDSTTPLIKLVDLTRTYFTGGEVKIEVLRGISLDIHAGEFVAIMGASALGQSFKVIQSLVCFKVPSQLYLHNLDESP